MRGNERHRRPRTHPRRTLPRVAPEEPPLRGLAHARHQVLALMPAHSRTIKVPAAARMARFAFTENSVPAARDLAVDAVVIVEIVGG